MSFPSFSVPVLSTSILNPPISGLIVICGATATGKSSLAIALAQQLQASGLNSAILSADSRQVYREFNIGTAKPTIVEQQQVPHYLIDICDPTQTLTVADYQAQAQTIIASFSSASMPLLVGGTGLYIRAVTKGLIIPRVPPQLELRSQLQALGQSTCYTMLQQVDPQSACKIHANDIVRTVRSLEVFYTTGRPISQQQGEHPPSYPILPIGLDCFDSKKLQQRIAYRATQMVKNGFMQEVSDLCHKYGTDLPLLNTLGYAEFKRCLSGQTSLTDALEQTILHTRQFAKRQRTWFRADSNIHWFDADAPDLVEQVWQLANKFLSSNFS